MIDTPEPAPDALTMGPDEYRRAKRQIIAASFQAQFKRRDADDAARAAAKNTTKKDA